MSRHESSGPLWAFGAAVLALTGTALLAVATCAARLPTPATLPPGGAALSRVQVVSRRGAPLSLTYDNRWNLHDTVPLHEIPEFLRGAFLAAEDGRFLEHRGVDWRARGAAVVQNLRSGRSVRGASTITEQVVRLVHPRPRTLWSRWLEGLEAGRLERAFSKGEILEFYLNQVPYARRRRGVVQAARDCFDRDLDTMSPREMLALAVMVRSPVRMDLRRGTAAAEAAVDRLAERMEATGRLSAEERHAVDAGRLVVRETELPLRAPHLVRHVRASLPGGGPTPLRVATTLDSSIQGRVSRILAHGIAGLSGRSVGDGAVLVADHRRGEILAWVNAGGFSPDEPGSQIDAVLAPRQPGSTLKPFLYALALERGWTAATIVEDTPTTVPVGFGLHRFHNYSGRHYGPVRVREALGNSLNVPAVRTLQSLGAGTFLDTLGRLGFASLDRPAQVYGDGLALGNGEVTLHELVGAYAALARGGVWQPLHVRREPGALEPPRRVFSQETSSIIADILSDPEARRLEFGRGGALELPVQTAVKTGTSNDYRDAWALGFSSRFVVGVWMGNLDRRPMKGVSGAVGPALVLRGVFAELHRDEASRPLALHRRLRRVDICRASGALAGPWCPVLPEWFRPGRAPSSECDVSGHGDRRALPSQGMTPSTVAGTSRPRLVRPTPGLSLALDPRIPDHMEAFLFELEAAAPVDSVEWIVDGDVVATTSVPTWTWPVRKGRHEVQARVRARGAKRAVETPAVSFSVR